MSKNDTSSGGMERSHSKRALVEQKVRQVLYGGDAYDAGGVFDKSEARMARRMLKDHVRPDGDDMIRERAENAIEQLEERYIDTETERSERTDHDV